MMRLALVRGMCRMKVWPPLAAGRLHPCLFNSRQIDRPMIGGNNVNARARLVRSSNRFYRRGIYPEPVGSWFAFLLVGGPQRGRRIHRPMACLQDELTASRSARGCRAHRPPVYLAGSYSCSHGKSRCRQAGGSYLMNQADVRAVTDDERRLLLAAVDEPAGFVECVEGRWFSVTVIGSNSSHLHLRS